MDNKIFRYKLNIRIMYGYWFFHNLIFAYVIERLYWASKGMTNQDVVYTEIIYAIVIVILEIPTGSIADSWNRKNIMLLSAVMSFVEFFILIYAHSFWQFSLAVSAAGIGKSLSSGTSNAIIYDSLKMQNLESTFEKVIGKVTFFDYSASTLAALLGSYIAYKSGNVTTYWLSLISTFIAFLLLYFLLEPQAVPIEEKPRSYFECITEAYNFIKDKSILKFVLAYGIVIIGVVTYIDEFWQVYANSVKVPVYCFGLISVARGLTSSFSGLFAYKIKENFSFDKVFVPLLVIITISVFLTGMIKNYYGLIPMIFIFFPFGFIEPLTMGYLHHHTESNIRATVESFQSLALRASTIIIGLIFGYFSTHYCIFIGFRALGTILFLYSVYYLISKNRRLV